MRTKFTILGAALLAMVGFVFSALANTWAQQQTTPAQGTQQTPGASAPQAPREPGAPSLINPTGSAPAQVTPPVAPPINPEEENAYKAFFDAHAGDPAKRVQLGEDFLKNFPDSHYRSTVYTQMTSAYMNVGQDDKMFAAGDKALELDPDNLAVLALLAMTLPRRPGSNTLDAAQQYQKAETYARRVIQLIPTVEKPDGIDDAAFQKAKSEYLSMAHSGLGLIDYQRKQFGDAITELSQAVQLSANPDPVDYYVLGAADMATNHFGDAVTAYGNCSESGPMVTQCKARGEVAKKRVAAPAGVPN